MSTTIESCELSTKRPKIENVQTGYIKKSDASTCSVSLILELSPGIIVTLASIIGIVVLNILEQPYLSIVSSIGTAAGAYTIYQCYKAHFLKTFQESNRELQASISMLNRQKVELASHIADFEAENSQLAQTTLGLQQNLEAYQEENQKLKKSNNTLQSTMSHLELTNKTLEETANAHTERLEALQESLSAIQNATEKDHTQFAQHVDAFISEVKKLQETNEEFGVTGSSFEKTILTMVQTTETLQVIFTKINEWKDTEYTGYLIQTQQSLQANLLELQMQIAKAEGQREAQQDNLKDLAEINQGFGRALDMLTTKTEEIKDQKKQLATVVQQFSEVVNDAK